MFSLGFTSDDVRLRFKSLSLLHHSDKGGEHAKMVLLGRALQVLRLIVGGVCCVSVVVTSGPPDSAREDVLVYVAEFMQHCWHGA